MQIKFLFDIFNSIKNIIILKIFNIKNYNFLFKYFKIFEIFKKKIIIINKKKKYIKKKNIKKKKLKNKIKKKL